MRSKTASSIVAILVAAGFVAAGCATPVGVKLVDGRTVHRSLTASALSVNEPSVYTKRTLLREGLFETFQEEPVVAIQKLHARYVESYQAGSPLQELLLFALAETTFLHAEATRDRGYFLASGLYAYAFLFPEEQSPPSFVPGGYGPFDPRVRTAADLYNRALAEGLASTATPPEPSPGEEPKRPEVLLTSRREMLPFGELQLDVDPGGFKWAGYRLDQFIPSADLQVRGLRNRYRLPGLGVPLAASLSVPKDGGATREVPDVRIPPRLKVPVSALVRIPEARRAIAGGQVRGRVSVHTIDVDTSVTIAGREVPLEYEPTAALAFTLEGAPVWDTELAGFLSGRFRLPGTPIRDAVTGGGPQAERPQDGLFMMTPHRPGKIPVVLVHGTASIPARWAELANERQVDPRIAEHYQIWLFTYNTGNPIAYSAALLREALRRAVKELDPEGKDPAFRRMVVIGHSQGGLLTKLTVVNRGT